jgi:predicted transcriptional regulator
MQETSVRLSDSSHQTLLELARQTGKSVEAVLERAIEEYRRKLFIEAANASYAALRADPVAWAEELAERRELEGTLMDGLDPDEQWGEDGSLQSPGQEEPTP